MSSYAADFTTHLAGALSHVAPSFVHPSPSSSSANLAAQGTQPHVDAVEAREQELRAILAKLRPSSSSQSGAASTSSASSSLSGRNAHSSAHLRPSHLAHLVDSAFPPFQGQASIPLSPQIETVELVTLAQLAIATYGVVLRGLMDEANELERHDEYWAAVESEAWNTALYLVQSAPIRAFSLANVTLTRLRQLVSGTIRTNDSSPPSLLSLTTWRRALPPSLFLTSVFPHLAGGSSGLPSLEDLSRAELDTGGPTSPSPSFIATSSSNALSLSRATKLGRKTARSLLFLTLSPLSLTRDEVATYRSKVRSERDDLARRIGELTLRAQGSEVGNLVEEGRAKRGVRKESRKPPGLAQLFSVSHQRAKEGEVELSLEDVRQATWQTLILLDSVLTPASTAPRMSSTPTPPSTPADLAHSLSYLLNQTLPAQSRAFTRTSLLLAPPSFWARSWPYLLSIPLLSSLVARAVYNHRLTLRQYALDAAETVRGFLFDWVLEPVRKILDTLRGGSADEVALMGRESLRSDLESLERMVVDFARDEWGLGARETEEMARKVRVGDLTEVLKVWEEDIKSPIKSTLRGSLIRTLLIQVQKVKVDVALATSGIEKMLKSQQLTFAFVGVAPSMLVLALVGRWVRGFVGRDAGSGKKRREEKKRCWLVVRQLDILLSSRPSSSSSSSSSSSAAAQTQGHLLLSLSRLRSHTLTPSFPSHDTQLLAFFLADIRALEERGATAEEGERRELVGRVREWARALRWDEGIRA
ncbi:nuclear controlof ATPase protein [Rhodotorula toruloides]|uniref:Nuclear controlof ATPase protein n=1 Tax=Rhodotorula toruloides TaxID=5286 RepID=A0A511KGL6_RHOTO|nr:nuclear controlof ATPase protein [Rhodotorula toruloides]